MNATRAKPDASGKIRRNQANKFIFIGNNLFWKNMGVKNQRLCGPELWPPPPPPLKPPPPEGAGRETGAGLETGSDRWMVCILCWPRLLNVLVSGALCIPVNAPLDSGRLTGAARSTGAGAGREMLVECSPPKSLTVPPRAGAGPELFIEWSSRGAAGWASSCLMTDEDTGREVAFAP
jgi:hypothetical protein